jgi:hypothetical protein
MAAARGTIMKYYILIDKRPTMKKLLIALAVTFAVAAPVAYDMVDALQFHNALEATHQAEKGAGDNKFYGPAF